MQVGEKLGLLPVTALFHVTLAKESLLLAGHGPWLKVFSAKSRLVLLQVEALPLKRVHGIRLVEERDNSLYVLLFGQRCLRCVHLHSNTTIKCEEMSEVYEQLDLILDVHCLSFETVDIFKVAIILAHNVVVLFQSWNLLRIVVPSSVNCILYSAQLRLTQSNELFVASGTVFNQILVWSIMLDNLPADTCPPLAPTDVALTLKGHEGVIFSVNFNKNLTQLATVSDDRSIRLWNLPSDWYKMSCKELTSSLVLYGHTARVWKVLWTPLHLLTIGEDATCRIWDHQGCCHNIITGHKGRNLWSITMDKENGIAFTGGGDCAIRSFKISDTKTGQDNNAFEIPVLSSHSEHTLSPRVIALWNNKILLCLSNDGSIHQMSTITDRSNTWSLFHSDPSFAGYSVMAIAKKLQLLAIGNLQGIIKLLLLPTANECITWQPHDGKIFSLVWLEIDDHFLSTGYATNELLLSSGPNGEMICWLVTYSNTATPPATITPLTYLTLPPSKHRWITSSVVLPSVEENPSLEDPDNSKLTTSDQLYLVCGDRKGSIHIYIFSIWKDKDKADSRLPVQSFNGVHGPNGVTHLSVWNGCVYSVGRDGHCRQYRSKKGQKNREILAEINKFRPLRGVNWLEGVIFTPNQGLLTYGFHGRDFILFNSATNKPLFTTACGGGHRSYALSSPIDIFQSGRVTFAFIKGSNVCIIQKDISNELLNPVIQEPFLGLEAMCVCELAKRQDTGARLLAVGSEDCTIVLVSVDFNGDSTISMAIVSHLEAHISSVRALTCVQSSYDHSTLLFSGGGRASLKVWLILSDTAETTLDPPNSLQCEYNLHKLPSKPQKRKRKELAPPECRVMSLTAFSLTEIVEREDMRRKTCLGVGCSDGLVRIYVYNEEEKDFILLEAIIHHHHCILTIKHLILPAIISSPMEATVGSDSIKVKTVILISAATDGLVVFWNITPLLEQFIYSYNISSNDLELDSNPPVATIVSEPISSLLILSVRTHQSGVNDLSLVTLNTDTNHFTFLLASVGDDNALTLSHCAVVSSNHMISMSLLRQASVLNAHYTTITGVQFISETSLLTSSIDQRLSLWLVDISGHEITVSKVSECLHDVADPSCLLIYQARKSHYAIVCGVGMECLALQFPTLGSVTN